MAAGFKKARRKARKVKFSIQGPSGGGKSYSALRIATALVQKTDPGKRIAFIDTEKSAELYAPPFDFDCDSNFGEGLNLSYSPSKLIEKLEVARKSGEYGLVIVDSLTHFWDGPGGFCAMHEEIGAKQKAKGKDADTWGNWKYVDPHYDNMWTYFRNYPLHLILCLRSEEKTERVNGKIVKQGLQPIFRKKWEYEVDAQFAVEEQGKIMVPLKHRLDSYLNDKVFQLPGENVAEVITEWINSGAAEEVRPVEETVQTETVASSAGTDIKIDIKLATDLDRLKAIAETIQQGIKSGLINADEKVELSKLYAARQAELKST